MKKLMYLLVAGTFFIFSACSAGGGAATEEANEAVVEDVTEDVTEVVAEEVVEDTAAAEEVEAAEATEE